MGVSIPRSAVVSVAEFVSFGLRHKTNCDHRCRIKCALSYYALPPVILPPPADSMQGVLATVGDFSSVSHHLHGCGTSADASVRQRRTRSQRRGISAACDGQRRCHVVSPRILVFRFCGNRIHTLWRLRCQGGCFVVEDNSDAEYPG